MGVAAQIEVHASLGSFLIDFRRVRQKHLAAIPRHGRECRRQIVSAVVVRVVNTGNPNTLVAGGDFRCLVDKHPDAHCLELAGHLAGVVIAQNAEDAMPCPHRGNHRPHPGVDLFARTMNLKPVISGEDAEIYRRLRDGRGHRLRQSIHAIDMEIGELENLEAVERRRQPGNLELDAAYFRPQSIGHTRAGTAQPPTAPREPGYAIKRRW